MAMDIIARGMAQNSLKYTNSNAPRPSVNIFNKNTVTSGYYINWNTGVLTASGSYSVSDYIKVKPNTMYSRKLGSHIVFYDSNKNMIAGSKESGLQFVTPPKSAYIRTSIPNTNLNTEQIEIGDVSTSYVDFQDTSMDVSKSDIQKRIADIMNYGIDISYSLSYSLKTNVIAVTNPSQGVRDYPFSGYGMLMNNTGNLNFNSLYLSGMKRSPQMTPTRKWAKIRCEVRNINQTGTLLAWGEVAVDSEPDALMSIDILLKDPSTNISKTLTSADLNTTFFVGFIAYSISGNKAACGDCLGTVSNYEGHSFYMNGTAANWQPYSGNPCVGIGLTSIANPVESYVVRTTDKFQISEVSLQGLVNQLIGASYDYTNGILLPDKLYSLVGKELNVYFDNIALGNNNYYDVVCNVGSQQDERFTLIPSAPGDQTLTVNIYDGAGILRDYKTTTIVQTAAAVGNGVNKKCLFIGDSTTANGITLTELNNNLFAGSEPMRITLLGTLGTNPVKHEGRSGWTLAKYYSDATSPFVFSGSFNFPQYMSTQGYASVDHVIINLGINDVFAYATDTEIDSAISDLLDKFTSIRTSILAFNSNIKIGICIPVPPPKHQDAFGQSYGCGQTKWRYKRTLLRFGKALMNKFYTGSTYTNTYIVPINVNIDTENNYEVASASPINSRSSKTIIRQINGVHPANDGYLQVADSYYYYLKSFES